MSPYPSLGSIQLTTFYKTYSRPNKPAAMISNRLLPLMWTKPGGSHSRKKQSKAEHQDVLDEKGENTLKNTERKKDKNQRDERTSTSNTHKQFLPQQKQRSPLAKSDPLTFSVTAPPVNAPPLGRLHISHSHLSLSERNKYRKRKRLEIKNSAKNAAH